MKRTGVFLLFLTGALSLFADIVPNPIELKSIMPNAETKVQMVSQKVTAKVYSDSSQVECIYLLKNWGQESTVEVGFPLMLFSYWGADAYKDNINQFLEVYIGSNKVENKNLYVPQTVKYLQERIRLREAYMDSINKVFYEIAIQKYGRENNAYSKPLREMRSNFTKKDSTFADVFPYNMVTLLERKNIPFYVWKVNFKPSETVSIKVNYRVPCGKNYRDSSRFFTYFLSTGAGWYKNMEKADVTVRLMDVDMNRVGVAKPSTVQKRQH